MSNENGRVILTVFTPVYNRAHLLQRLYASITNGWIDYVGTRNLHTDCMIEWVVVDDGSSDNPVDVLHRLQCQGPVPIRVISQSNRGKHVAHNVAIYQASGDWFLPVDSDDVVVPQSLSRLIRLLDAREETPVAPSVICVGWLTAHFESGATIGSPFPTPSGSIVDYNEIRYRASAVGDKAEAWRLTFLRDHPFPDNQERFSTEATVWIPLAERGGALVFNEPLIRKQYLPNGLTAKYHSLLLSSPCNWKTYLLALLRIRRKLTYRRFLKTALAFPLSAFLCWYSRRRRTGRKTDA